MAAEPGVGENCARRVGPPRGRQAPGPRPGAEHRTPAPPPRRSRAVRRAARSWPARRKSGGADDRCPSGPRRRSTGRRACSARWSLAARLLVVYDATGAGRRRGADRVIREADRALSPARKPCRRRPGEPRRRRTRPRGRCDLAASSTTTGLPGAASSATSPARGPTATPSAPPSSRRLSLPERHRRAPVVVLRLVRLRWRTPSTPARAPVRRLVPGPPDADAHVERHRQVDRVAHPLADERLQRLALAGRHLEHEFVVHLQQHPRRQPRLGQGRPRRRASRP